MAAFPKQFDMFELKTTPDKGIGAFATTAMPAGTSFFKEIPIMTFNKPWYFITEHEIAGKYNRLSAADKTLFDEARHDRGHPPGCKCMKGTTSLNSFGNPPKIYPIGSRFNHSCDPNITMLYPLKGVYQTFRTLRAVEAGEELSFCYADKINYLTTAQRKVELSDDAFHFTCLCSLCQLPATQRLASDLRRVLLRHLRLWLRKKDIADVQLSPALLETAPDPKLMERGVYTLLYAMLQEAEGMTSGGDAYLGYGYSVLHVLNVAFHSKLMCIPPRIVQDMRMWMHKSEQNVLLQYGDLSEGQNDWQCIRQAADPACVPDSGELDWEKLFAVAAETAKGGMRFFSAVPP